MIRTAAFKNFCFAVTGNPVLHSKSPVIFNTIFQRLGMSDSHVYTRIAANTPAEAMFLFKELRLTGMNVTAPFKANIMVYLDEVDDAAKTIGGVNTVVREEMGIKGYNTDYMGVTGALATRGIDLEGKRCVVLGAGGAGRAAVYGLLWKKASVTLVNRLRTEKALAVAGDRVVHAKKWQRCRSCYKVQISWFQRFPRKWILFRRIGCGKGWWFSTLITRSRYSLKKRKKGIARRLKGRNGC